MESPPLGSGLEPSEPPPEKVYSPILKMLSFTSLSEQPARSRVGSTDSPKGRREDNIWYTDRHLMYQEIDNFELDEDDGVGLKEVRDGSKNGGIGGDGDKDGDEMTVSMLFRIILYGVVNVIMAVPSMYGYAAVIFRDPAYVTDMASLAKLVCFSSAIHQVMFGLLSAMPFSIGQVQDAGLIFLSKMASSIAQGFEQYPEDTEEEQELKRKSMISTAIVTLGLGTACLGSILIVVGRAKMTKFVAYLPVPVISGYLAFIGFFCIEAGLSLCTSKAVTDWSDIVSIASDPHDVILSIPGLIAGLILCIVSRKAEGETTLPAVMMAIPLLFYLTVYMGGWTLDDARDFGWVGPNSPHPGSISSLIDSIDFSLVDWSLVPDQLPVFFSMVFVVAFSSCLDVAAIEMDVGKPLDVDSELATVGWSNLVSGLCGGFTGSYIFSQTIFTCRSGCHSKGVGMVVAVAEFAVVFIEVDLLAWVPLFFFAATLIFIGFDLILEWLFDVRHKLDFSEYLVVIFTFGAIECLGLDEGLMWGVLSAALQFLYHYSQQSQVAVVSRQSMVLRTAAASAMIHRQYKKGVIATLELRGSLFFGSSLRILEEVKEVLNGSHTMPTPNSNHQSAMENKGTTQNENHSMSFLSRWFTDSSSKPSVSDNAKKLNTIGEQSIVGGSGGGGGGLAVSPSQPIKKSKNGGTWSASSKKLDMLAKSPSAAGSALSFTRSRALTTNTLNLDRSTQQQSEFAASWDDSNIRQLKKNSTGYSLVSGNETEGLVSPTMKDSSEVGYGSVASYFLSSNPPPLNVDEEAELGLNGQHDLRSSLSPRSSQPSISRTADGQRITSSGLRDLFQAERVKRDSECERVIPISPKPTDALPESNAVSITTPTSFSPLHQDMSAASSESANEDLEVSGLELGPIRSKSGRANFDSISSSTTPVPLVRSRPRYLVLEFTHVSSVDATAVHSCFGPIARLTQTMDVKLVYAGCQPAVESQLELHGAFNGDHIRIFPTVHRALDWCESVIIARARYKLEQVQTQNRHLSVDTSPQKDYSPRIPLTPTGPTPARSSATPSPTNSGLVSPRRSNTKASSKDSGERVLKVGTLLRQWLELRPEIPPAQVRSWLFLGGAHHACDRALLQRFDIGFILNVADDISNFFENEEIPSSNGDVSSGGGGGGSGNGNMSRSKSYTSLAASSEQPFRKLQYCNLNVSDYGQDVGISRCFPEAVKFARKAKKGFDKGEGRMLVHCRFGMNRSPTVVTALLMELESLSLKQAWKSLKTLCHSAYPQVDNRRELVAYEIKRIQEKKMLELKSSATTAEKESLQTLPAVQGSMNDEEFKSHGLDDAEHLSVYCRTEGFRNNEAIYMFGDHADELYLLLGGMVDLAGADGTVRMTFSPGNVFGFVDCQLGKPRSTSAFARSRKVGGRSAATSTMKNYANGGDTTDETEEEEVVQVAAISMASMERMSVDHPSIAIKLMKVLLRQSSLELSNT